MSFLGEGEGGGFYKSVVIVAFKGHTLCMLLILGKGAIKSGSLFCLEWYNSSIVFSPPCVLACVLGCVFTMGF